MAKEFKRGKKDSKGKRPASKGDSSEKRPFKREDKDTRGSGGFKRKDDGDSKEKSTESRPSRTVKKDKPAFERFRDDSRPSDFGSSKRSRGPERSGKSEPEYKRRSESPSYSRDKPDKKAGSFRKKDTKDSYERKSEDAKTERAPRKTFSSKTPAKKPKSAVNPYDLDESDMGHGTEKKSFSSERGRDFKKKPYVKKPYEKKAASGKGASKPQRETDDGLIRLNKYLANAGICSRREADHLIETGVVQVNGKTITEMGYRVKPTDIIKYGGQTLKKERMVYLILNKPKDYITTIDDPQQRRTVLELVQGACKERIYPVGRLDRATTGLLMFTNDGDLTKKLTHPRYGIRKIYHVELDKPLKRQDLDAISEGIELEDGPIKVDEVTYVGDAKDKTQVGVEIHSGKNRIVRRIFEHMGYNVRKLDRVLFGSLTKKDLARGRWRMLTDAEVGMLKMISSEK
ncbi:MAG: pseudouridine synthase [Bacteroidota bacterium]|nr:pseudouridine synthase [Bacteroidota bacterium]